MKYLVLFALFAFALADDVPTPVEDTPEVAMAKADHLKAVEYQKALIASLPKEVPFPYYAHPYAYNAVPYTGYYPYSHFNYGYSAVAPHYPYAYSAFPYTAYPYTYPFAVKAVKAE